MFKKYKFFEGISFGKDVFDKQDHFELSPEYLTQHLPRFKKLTATRLAAALGKDRYTTPFKLWCLVTGIFIDADMDPMVAKVGTVIEPKLRKYLEKKYNTEYTFYEPKDYGWDLWKGVDDVFGGIPDGEPMTDGKVDYSKGAPLIELKTTSIDKFVYKPDQYGDIKLIKDENGNPIVKTPGAGRSHWLMLTPVGDKMVEKVVAPKNYVHQLCLYMYLRKQTRGAIYCCMVDTPNYPHPENVIPNESNIVGSEITLNLEKFKRDVIDPAREWYYKYVKAGISPKITEDDRIWIQKHLQK